VSNQGARSPGSDSVAEVTPLSQPAERVQAALFAALLRSEVSAMRKSVAKAESEWQSRCDAEGYVDPPDRFGVVQERIKEAVRMLDALNTRFPRT
jgi:hypothetical protein